MTNNSQSSSSIFRNRDFLDYFGMNLTSRSAGQVANVALIWVVFAITRSALDVAIVGVTETVAAVVMTLPAGVWVDRHNRRFLLVLSNSLRTICLLLLILFTGIIGFQLIGIIAIAFIWNAATEIYRSTDYSLLPDLVRSEELANANGVTRAGYRLVGSVSNILGGALVAFVGVALAFLFSTVGYALAALFSAFLFYRFRSVRIQQKPESQKEKRVMSKEIKEGFLWLVMQKGLFQLSLSALVFNFLLGMPNYFMVVYVSVALKAGALLFGGVLASYVIGSAVGSLLVKRTNAIAYTGKVWITLYGATAGALLLLQGLFPTPLFAISANFVTGITSGFGGNVWLTSAQNLVPSQMRGRFFAIDGLLSFVGGPPSIAVGGILVTLIGVLPVFEVSGIAMLLFALVFAFMKSLWALDGRGRVVPQ